MMPAVGNRCSAPVRAAAFAAIIGASRTGVTLQTRLPVICRIVAIG